MTKKTKVTTPHGIRTYARMNVRDSIPEAGARLRVSVQTDVLDRYEGLTTIEEMWSTTRNDRYIARALKDDVVRREVARVFLSRALHPALTSVIVIPSLKIEETSFSKMEFVKAMTNYFTTTGIEGKPLSQPAINAVLELIMSELIRVGFVSPNGAYTQAVSYGFSRVTTRDIRDVVTLTGVRKALLNIKLNIPTKRMSKGVFAEKVAEAFRPVGIALSQTQEIDSVLDDILVGVSAVLDPDSMARVNGLTIPSSWRTNPVVHELSTCLPFVRAALSLPKSTRGLVNDAVYLENWASAFIEALRDSDRYYIATRERALEHYGVQRVYDGYGVPVSALAFRAVEAVPVGQAVIATPDAIFTDQAWDISATYDRIAEAIQRAYGSARFGTEQAATMLHATASDIASLGFQGDMPVWMLDAAGSGYTLSDIAVLRASELYVETSGDGVVTRKGGVTETVTGSTREEEANWEPAWWFKVDDPSKVVAITSGVHYGDVVLTCDPVEVLLAMDDFLPKSVMPPRPQLLEERAFNTRLMRYDAEELVKRVTSRFEVNITFAGQAYKTAFRAQDFASLRAVDITSVVVPQYNKNVITTYEAAFEAVAGLVELIGQSGKEDWKNDQPPPEAAVSVLRRRCARTLIYASQKLDPAFRAEVQEVLVSRVILAAGAAGVQQQLMRSQMMQQAFTTTADVTALLFFMFMQGIPTPFWLEDIVPSTEFAAAALEVESDRRPKGRI